MRAIIIILTILSTVIIASFRLPTNILEIKGQIKKNPERASIDIGGLTVLVKADDKIVGHAVTNEPGMFSLTFTPVHEKIFDFYCVGAGIDTLLLFSTDHFENDETELTLYVPGKIKKDTFGKIYCPKCKRPDRVYNSVHKGFTVYYCDRDKVRF